MLYPRVTGCSDCANINCLIDEIDCKLAKLAGDMFYNITLMFNKPIPIDATSSLLMYKRILERKNVNPQYLVRFTVSDIASRIKILKYKK